MLHMGSLSPGLVAAGPDRLLVRVEAGVYMGLTGVRSRQLKGYDEIFLRD